MDKDSLLSNNAKSMRRSAIRDLLSVIASPEVISFAGGLPNSEAFPIEDIRQITKDVLDEQFFAALQYGTTEGYVPLREEIAAMYKRDENLDIDIKNILITTASQQSLDLLSRIFLNPGDTIICGLPSYVGALQAFWSYQGSPQGIKSTYDLEAKIIELRDQERMPKFIYAIPDFQNPSGVTMDMAEREYVIDIARKYDLPIIEDSPYKQIRYEGEPLPTLYSLDPERVVLLGTFSKTFVPGFRLGWVVAPEWIIGKLVVAKQSADLCTPAFCQIITARYLEAGLFEKNIQKIRSLYKHKKDVIIAAFEKFMPEGVRWTDPDGGLFLFLWLPEQYDARELFDFAIKDNVAFVLGEAFHCDGSGKNTLRINFSYASDERLREGVARLARAIKKLYAKYGN